MNNDEFRAAMQALPEPPSDSSPPYWSFWRHSLWQHVVTGDDPGEFMGWPEIFHTQLVNHWPQPIQVEFNALPGKMLPAVDMPYFGSPPDHHGNSPYSRNMIHQAYHIHRFQDTAHRYVDTMQTIVEFGGGYGALALLIHRLGFKGRYIIFDLPEFSLLQQYYLSKFDITVEHYTDMSALPQVSADLLVACYSLSETDFAQRDAFLAAIPSKNYLFLYSNRFAGLDNVDYFQKYATGRPDKSWSFSHITHLPDNNFYCFGW
ncbi:MAG: hypothetical protein A2W23_06035 [Planctomycetes bacterium RBG_16_43_13]|nr:MAG: hypothetical protein A2W23_06035 [Planctomycetes bacterium RBG_16_43_13]